MEVLVQYTVQKIKHKFTFQFYIIIHDLRVNILNEIQHGWVYQVLIVNTTHYEKLEFLLVSCC